METSPPPGPEIGTLIPTTNRFSRRPPVVKEFFLTDRPCSDGHLRWLFGRIDPENYVGGHRLQPANTLLSPTKAFSSNPAIAYPSIGSGRRRVKPVDWFYVLAGATDANAHDNAADGL